MLNARRKQPPGFSLIELLVVIAVVVVLIGILIPTLRGVREASRRAVLLSNLSGAVKILHTYAHDQRDVFPSTGAPFVNVEYPAAARSFTLPTHFWMSEDWSLFLADGYLGGQLLPNSVSDPRGGRVTVSCTTLADPNYFDPYLWTGPSQFNGQRLAEVRFPSRKSLTGTNNSSFMPSGLPVDPRWPGAVHPVGFGDGHATEIRVSDWPVGFGFGCQNFHSLGRHGNEAWPGAHSFKGIRGTDIN